MRFTFIAILFFSTAIALGQSEQLAKNYIEQGQYEKALLVYQRLYESNPNRLNYILGLVGAYQELEQFDHP